MRATIWNGIPHQVTVKSIPKPRLKTSEDALVRLTSAAICGSDLHIYRGLLGSKSPPWVLGHEGVGIVQEVGEAVQNVKPGDRVVVPCVHDDGVLNLDGVPNLASFGLGADFFNGDNGGIQGEEPGFFTTESQMLTRVRLSGVRSRPTGRYVSDPYPTLPLPRTLLHHGLGYLGHSMDVPRPLRLQARRNSRRLRCWTCRPAMRVQRSLPRRIARLCR